MEIQKSSEAKRRSKTWSRRSWSCSRRYNSIMGRIISGVGIIWWITAWRIQKLLQRIVRWFECWRLPNWIRRRRFSSFNRRTRHEHENPASRENDWMRNIRSKLIQVSTNSHDLNLAVPCKVMSSVSEIAGHKFYSFVIGLKW